MTTEPPRPPTRERVPFVRAAVRVCALLIAAGAATSADAQGSLEVFDRHSRGVVQIQVVEKESGGKAGIGSGFVVSDGGRVVTNYHVISEVVHHPERYALRLSRGAGEADSLHLLAFDLVHDLAVLEPHETLEGALRLAEDHPRKGTRLYSLGNPYDLGLSVVEGTYNGLLEHSRHERIHFTGSLNPGMSGGPAVLLEGQVVGVNVASAGEQVSFLVPVDHVRELLEQTLATDFEPVDDLAEEARRQLDAYQEEYLKELLGEPLKTVSMGPYAALTEPAPYFNCWGDATHDEDDLYEVHQHQCSTNDGVYLSREQAFSIVRFRHRYLRSDQLAPSRFYNLYSSYFEGNFSQVWGREEYQTEFRCRTRFVHQDALRLKATFCARRHVDLRGLYDAVFKAAVLGSDDAGFETALVLSSVSFDNAERFARRYLEAIAWQP